MGTIVGIFFACQRDNSGFRGSKGVLAAGGADCRREATRLGPVEIDGGAGMAIRVVAECTDHGPPKFTTSVIMTGVRVNSAAG